jgi:hypothetical protein
MSISRIYVSMAIAIGFFIFIIYILIMIMIMRKLECRNTHFQYEGFNLCRRVENTHIHAWCICVAITINGMIDPRSRCKCKCANAHNTHRLSLSTTTQCVNVPSAQCQGGRTRRNSTHLKHYCNGEANALGILLLAPMCHQQALRTSVTAFGLE